MDELQRLENWWNTASSSDKETPAGKEIARRLIALKQGASPSSVQQQVGDDPTLGQIGGGLATEVSIAAAGKYGGAAIGSAVPIIGTGIGYTVGAIGSGIAGSVAAQKIEGRKNISWGRAIAAGLVNLIPGSELGKGTLKTGKALATAGKIGFKEGAITGAAEAQLTSIIDERQMASLGTTAAYAGFGGGIGSVLGTGVKAVGLRNLNKIKRVTKGKSTKEIDELIDNGTITKEDVVELSLHGYNGDKNQLKPIIKREVERTKSASINMQAQMGFRNQAHTEKGFLTKLFDKLPKNGIKDFIAGSIPTLATGRRVADTAMAYKNMIKQAEDFVGKVDLKISKFIANNSELDFKNPDEITLYHGGSLTGKVGDRPFIHTSKDPLQAKAYADEVEGGQVFGVRINPKKIADEEEVHATLEELGIRANDGEGMMHELMDPAFQSEGFYIGDKNVQAVKDALQKKGFVGYRATGHNVLKANQYADEFVLFDIPNSKPIKGDIFLKEKINNFLDGGELDPSLKPLERDLTVYRNHLEETQDTLIALLDDGALDGYTDVQLKELAEKVRASRLKGNYTTREYKMFLDKNYDFTTPELQKKREIAKRALIKKYTNEQDVSDPRRVDPETRAEEQLKAYERASAFEQSVAVKGPARTPVDAPLKGRKLDPVEDKEVMDYLGIVDDPQERIRGTLTSTVRMVARAQADKEIDNILLAMGMASTKRTNKFSVELEGRGGRKGIFVEPSTKIGVNKIYASYNTNQIEDTVGGTLLKVVNSALGLGKAVKVLGNPPSYAVQVWGNAANITQLGMNPLDFKNMKQAFRVALSDFNFDDPKVTKEILEDIKDAQKYGIKGTNIIESDIRQNLMQGFDAVDKLVDPFAKAYAVPDTLFRYLGWKQTQEQLRRIYKDANPEDIKRAAAALINDTYQNYDKLNPLIRKLAQYGGMPQFASFTAEFARNQYYQGKHILQLMNGTYAQDLGINLGKADKKVMQRIGATRAAATAGVYGATAGVAYAAERLNPFGKEVDSDMKRAFNESVMYDYDKTSPYALSISKDGREYSYANLSYIAPQALFLKAFQLGLGGGDAETDLFDLAKRELLGEGAFAFRAFMMMSGNIDLETGRKISVKEDDLARYGQITEAVLEDLLKPGIAREIDKVLQSKEFTEGKGRFNAAEIAGRQFGLRINKGIIDDRIITVSRDTFERAKTSRAQYRSFLRRAQEQGMSPAAVQSLYQEKNADYKATMEVMQRHYKNYMVLGRTQSEIIKLMKEAGVSSEELAYLVSGNVDKLNIPMQLSESVPERMRELEESLGLDFTDGSSQNVKKLESEIKERFTDPYERKRAFDYVKKIFKTQNLSDLEQLIGRMDIDAKVRYFDSIGMRGNMYELEKLFNKGVLNEREVQAIYNK